MRPFVRWCALAIAVTPLWAAAQRPAIELSAVVSNKQITVDFPPLSATGSTVASRQIGFYAWRISVDAPGAFTIVLMADTAMRLTKPDDILRASTLRLCPTASPRSVLECTALLEARVTGSPQHVRVTIRDTAFVARVRRDRPFVYWRSVIEPGGRIQLAQLRWEYVD
jgi:hypothetical protein